MKRLVLLFTLCCTATGVLAQIPQTQFGLRVGANLAQLRGTKDAFGTDATDRKLGLTLGAFAEVPLLPMLSLQPELLYTQKGGSVDASFIGEDPVGNVKSSFTLNYLELPMLVKYNVPTGSRVRPSLYAGPYVAYSLKRSIDLDLKSDEGDNLDVSFDADDTFKRLNYGTVFGIDFGHRWARRAATIGLRYNLGLANVFKNDIVFSEDEDPIDLGGFEARAHEFSVVLGVKLF